MKTEFNVERVCERVHMCYVEAPEELGHPVIEINNGSLYVKFEGRMVNNKLWKDMPTVHSQSEEPADVPSLQPAPEPDQAGDAVGSDDATAADFPKPTNPGRRGRRGGK